MAVPAGQLPPVAVDGESILNDVLDVLLQAVKSEPPSISDLGLPAASGGLSPAPLSMPVAPCSLARQAPELPSSSISSSPLTLDGLGPGSCAPAALPPGNSSGISGGGAQAAGFAPSVAGAGCWPGLGCRCSVQVCMLHCLRLPTC